MGYCIARTKACGFRLSTERRIIVRSMYSGELFSLRQVLKIKFWCFAARVLSTSVAAAINFTVLSRFLWFLAYAELNLDRKS